MLVGDSMNRNQFESMLCLLREGLPDKSKMFEIHGRRITKGRGYYVFKFVVITDFIQLCCLYILVLYKGQKTALANIIVVKLSEDRGSEKEQKIAKKQSMHPFLQENNLNALVL